MFDIYIAGPMTGIKAKNYSSFNEAAKQLRAKGYTVVNPAELDSADLRDSWEDSMRRDINMLIRCENIATLDGWSDSRGAMLECYIGAVLGMKVQPVLEFLTEGI